MNEIKQKPIIHDLTTKPTFIQVDVEKLRELYDLLKNNYEPKIKLPGKIFDIKDIFELGYNARGMIIYEAQCIVAEILKY